MRVRADGLVAARPLPPPMVVTAAEEGHGHTFSDLDQLDGPDDPDGIGDKGKRRTDHRCDSSESSDSGVATLSPGTNDSLELISPYSPCDLSLEPSDLSSCGSGSSPSSSSSSSSTSSLCDLGPDLEQEVIGGGTTTTTIAPKPPIIMTAVAAPKPKVPVTNFISFQIPQAHVPGYATAVTSKAQALKFIEPKNVVQSSFHCDVRKFSTGSTNIKKIIAALGYETGESGSAVVVARNNVSSADLKTTNVSRGGSVVEQFAKGGATRQLPNLRGPTKSYLVRGEGKPSKVIILSGFPKVGGLPTPTAFGGLNPPPPTTTKIAAAAAAPLKSKTCSLSSTTDKILVDLTEDDDDEETRPSSSCSPAKKKKCRLQGPLLVDTQSGKLGGLKNYSQTRNSPLLSSTSSSSSSNNININSNSIIPQNNVHSSGGPKKTDPGEIVEVSSSTCTTKSKPPTRGCFPLPPPPLFPTFGFRTSTTSEVLKKQTSSTSLTVATPDSSTSEDHEPVAGSKLASLSSSSSSSSTSPAPLDDDEDESMELDIQSLLTGAFIDSSLPTSSTGADIVRSANPSFSPTTSSSISRKRRLVLDEIISVKSHSSSGSGRSNSFVTVSTTNSNDSATSISPPPSVAAVEVVEPPTPSTATFPLATKKSERLLAKSSTTKGIIQEYCMWKDCICGTETNLNFLEHIQTTHVAPQTKAEGYSCLWEGCKVFNKKSCSLSWLERHVLSHGGNKPFRCIFPGCGLCFSAQGALERHVNSHITTNIHGNGANGHSSIARKLDSSPSKNARRKKQRGRKQKLNTGHVVDFFDKRTMEVIKHRLSGAIEFEKGSMHNCTFNCQVLSRRTTSYQEPHFLVRWYPEYVLPDEWIPQSKYVQSKSIPLRQIPPDKIRVLFPNMFPPERKEKASRKWKPNTGPTPAAALLETVKRNWKEKMSTLPPVTPCGCQDTRPDGCTPLDSDWAVFLAERIVGT